MARYVCERDENTRINTILVPSSEIHRKTTSNKRETCFENTGDWSIQFLRFCICRFRVIALVPTVWMTPGRTKYTTM
jgi:hypothetical protein